MGKALNIKGTYDTPAITFDTGKGIFSISGRSLPANSFEFYSPVLNVVTEYLNNPASVSKFDFKMDFISSSSTKIFQQLLFELEQAYQKGAEIKVSWYYKFGDDDMKDLGDDLRLDAKVPFEFIAYE